MRWPVKFQLLLPMLGITVLAIVLTAAAAAYLGAAHVRRQQEQDLHRVVATLSESNFPLTEGVLRQMRGLSGAEFVRLDDRQKIVASTMTVAEAERADLGRLHIDNLSGEVAAQSAVELGGRRYLAYRVPVIPRVQSEVSGSLIVLYEEQRRRAAMWQAVYPALGAGSVAAAVAVALATALAHRFVRPIRRLGQETARIAEGRFQPLPVPPRNDEIRDLTLAVNSMAEKLGRYEQEVRTSERLRTLGQLQAGLSHQLRNWATGAQMAIELHLRQCAARDGDESLAVAQRQLRLMESYLQRFMRIGRDAGQAYDDNVDLTQVLDDALELLRPTCAHGKVQLEAAPRSATLRVRGNVDALRDLFLNVLLNAVEAARRARSGAPRVTVETELAAAERAVIRVKDTGAGPAAEVQERLFDPFVSEKPEGTGLGLFMARQIVEAHGGSIGWQRENGVTCFSIELPLVS